MKVGFPHLLSRVGVAGPAKKIHQQNHQQLQPPSSSSLQLPKWPAGGSIEPSLLTLLSFSPTLPPCLLFLFLSHLTKIDAAFVLRNPWRMKARCPCKGTIRQLGRPTTSAFQGSENNSRLPGTQ